jgi:uncharacterized membrane protein
LLESNSKANELTQIILCIVDEKSPQTVQELMDFVQEKGQWSNKEIIANIMKLQAESKIRLNGSSLPVSLRLVVFLGTNQALWYWATVAIAVISMVLAVFIREGFYPWVYLKIVFGLIFVLWLPGYTFLKVLFPVNKSINVLSTSLSNVEQIALSVIVSIALLALIGLILNFSPWGLNLTSIVLSLFTFSLVFATAGVVREYIFKREVQR